MIGKYKHHVILLVLFIFSFCILVSAVAAKSDSSIPKNKIVALVYDDSGSMWEQSGNVPIDNWKYANYALQSFVALLEKQDQLRVVSMSTPTVPEPIELDERLRQHEIDQIRAWTGKKSTPLESLHTAINELKKAADHNKNSEYWLIVLTDGIFNELNHLDQKLTTQQIVENKKALFTSLRELKEKMDQNSASFHSELIPIESYLSTEELEIMADFKRQWTESSEGNVLVSNGEQDIIQRINEVAALMTNRDPSEQDRFDLHPVWDGKQLVLESPFPLRRITLIEQSAEENASFKEFYMNNQRIEQGMEGPYKVITPEDPANLHPPIQGTFTHFKNVNGNGVIERGTYKIVFDKPLTEEQQKSIRILAEPAIDFRVDPKKNNDDGKLTDDPSVFFAGSKMRLEATLLKSESNDEEIDLRDIDVKGLFEVEADINGVKLPLSYDSKVNKFIGDFTLPQKQEIPIKVKVSIKGFYQKVKESSLQINPTRKLSLVANNDTWRTPLDKLNDAEPFVITPMVNGEEMSSEELKKVFKQLKINTLSDIKIEIEQKGNQILIYPKSLSPIFRTSVGDVPIHVTLPGPYPNEIAEEMFTLHIEDISHVKKYGKDAVKALIWLVLLVYIFGIIIKPRFDKNRISLEYKQSRKRERLRDARGMTESFHTNWFNRWLIPYLAEKKSIGDLTFKADRKKDRVLLVKESQDPTLIVRHEKLEGRSKKADILIYHNDEIQIERSNDHSVYIFKSH
ncbi:VWA domain-containing protein [Neobacillus niacini]|uniref:vWA domain-containing protein n=1 Tax=Neobacillus niacini TaxID=86668 RepID=UPI0007ABCC48|nr:vWA domain-containing protein [Neobacillus niacini]MEC1520428.1 VWA domain-containing protein [Neobacillus niacini]